MNSKSFKGYLMIFLSALGFGSYGVWSRSIGEDFGVFFQGWVRSALVLLALLPYAYFTKSFTTVRRADLKWLLTPVIFGIFTQAPIYWNSYSNILCIFCDCLLCCRQNIYERKNRYS
jgi:drug/metabolite transporter (DMT)-like permease